MANDNSAGAVTIPVMATRIGPKKPVRVYLSLWRENQKLTQQQVADRIGQGIHKGTVSRWESAKRVPSTEVLAAYAEALGRPVTDLYRRPADPGEDVGMILETLKPATRKQAIRLIKALAEEEAA